MKTQSISTTTIVIMMMMTICLVCIKNGQGQSYNNDCDFINIRCDRTVGLYCNEEQMCKCSQDRFDATHNYTLVWSQSAGRCVGSLGSVCIGTANNPAAADSIQQFCDQDLVCVQLAGYVLSVGECQKSNTDKSGAKLTMTPSSTLLTLAAAMILLTFWRT